MAFRTLDQAALTGKRALVRVDFNVPMADGAVSDDTRLRAAIPTVRKIQAGGGKVVLIAHFDRPKGKRVDAMSLAPVAPALARLLGEPVAFAEDCVGAPAAAALANLPARGVLLMENLRFHAGEEANDPEFAKALAASGDLYVNDAFSAAHRAHASTEGLARVLPAYAGESMRRELEMLEKALGRPERPVMGIVGGAKVSTKLELLENLTGKLQVLAIGGGMANTFLFAKGYGIGGSLCEKEMADTAREILAKAEKTGCRILLPTDVVTAAELKPGVAARTVTLTKGDGLSDQDKIFDIGPDSLAEVLAAMRAARTLIWNGPFGVFEVPPFDAGTVAAARAAGDLAKGGKLVAVAGGGDTVAALNAAGAADDFSFVSTAGGAFLEWMEGKTLPGVAALASQGS